MRQQYQPMEDRHLVFKFLGRKKSSLMAPPLESNTAIPACFTGLLVALIVPFATTVSSALIITAPGWANALDW